MKPIYVHLGGALALSFTIAACVPAPDSTPAPTPTPTPTPSPTATAPAPQRPAPPASENWIDRPQTAGDWSYRAGADGGVAMFGANADKPLFAIDCDRGAARVTLSRIGSAAAPATMTIRTETTDRTLAATPAARELRSLTATLAANDPLLDAMAVTRGRFAVETPGLSTLYLPTWAEVSRVIEDCR
ncbi:hypothetical protein K7H13_05225 [Qipengyuania citrea]|uniref:hypothetical protein n=1 Tax=Qipengyuania citrea TaxID=225971 RepID=UPI001E32DC6D|nr:hypothetical protein [Qipengyuania citrea]MCD1590161.1 hypothetical protein [Qipengyuania citrea]MCZ4265895.1 hypothetical protein [Erythrobacter sp. G21629-S1]